MKRSAGQTLVEYGMLFFLILTVAIAVFAVMSIGKEHSSGKKAKQAVAVSQKAKRTKLVGNERTDVPKSGRSQKLKADTGAYLASWIVRPPVNDMQDGWYRVRQIEVGQSKDGKSVTGYEILDEREQVITRLVDVGDQIEQITLVPYSVAHGREHEWVLNKFDHPSLHPGNSGHLVVRTMKGAKQLLFFCYVAAGSIGEDR